MRAKYLKPAILVSIYIGISQWSGNALAQNADASNLYKRSLAATCANCHGTKGSATGAMPSLAGLKAGYISEQMRAYRDGKRPGTIMHQLAKGYTDAQIDLIAGYFAAQTAK